MKPLNDVDLNVPEKKILPRLKFTGQQPGEEGVARDSVPEEDDQDEEPDDQREIDEDGERIVPIKDPADRVPRV